jgi:lysophospholipase L1-like esterase
VTPASSAAISLARRYTSTPAGAFAACEQRVESDNARSVPRLVIVGASFTAGVGPGSTGRSWAVVLARMLGADAVVSGVPGAGYVRAGASRQGPVGAMLSRLDLRTIGPGLVIVQAGHDDIGEPAISVSNQVTRAISFIHAEDPRARIALITVFRGHTRWSAAVRTDRAITSAATAARRGVIILDPLTGRWTYQHISDGLHPTAAGDVTIARDVAAALRARGVLPGPPTAGNRSPVICVAPGPRPGSRPGHPERKLKVRPANSGFKPIFSIVPILGVRASAGPSPA